MTRPKPSDAAVAKATGKTWNDWVRLLDKLGAREMAHQSIAELLRAQHRLDGWWAQAITVGYEQSKGLRRHLERADGFAACISRTVNTELGRLYEAFSAQAAQLEKAGAEVQRTPAKKAVRVTLDDGSRLDVNFSGKGAGKSQISVEHRQLKSAGEARESKAFWKQALDELQDKLSKLG